ncbi:hypothetical protein N657DRAFT_643225 [Parathielavia appendiculata]|uniref:Uncharacterized protein n=1 Tax=Parathielavia appendiculata TaxID=2587402 RepID=A0AAN6U4Q7_9PEZI|nr:hypothetical protein N657DRAFT_643225 [Parathielavia appendiculata]
MAVDGAAVEPGSQGAVADDVAVGGGLWAFLADGIGLWYGIGKGGRARRWRWCF